MIITDDNFNNLITEAKKKKVPDLKVVKGTPKAKKLSSFKAPFPSPQNYDEHLKNLTAEKSFWSKKIKKAGPAEAKGIRIRLKKIETRRSVIKKSKGEAAAKLAKRSHLTSVGGGVKGSAPIKGKPTTIEVGKLRRKLQQGEKLTKRDLDILKKAAKSKETASTIRKAVSRPSTFTYVAFGIIALSIISATYDWYEERIGKAKRRCMNASNKDECMAMHRQLAYVARIKDLQAKKSYCDKSDNSPKCKFKVDQKISQIRARIKRG